MQRLERAGIQGDIGPKLNEEHDMEYWVEQAKANGTLAPQPKKENEKEQPITVSYDELVKSWQDSEAAMPASATPASAEGTMQKSN